MDCLVESCTIHDDLYLNYNDLSDTTQSKTKNNYKTSFKSKIILGTNVQNISRSFESANAYSYYYSNDYRFIIW